MEMNLGVVIINNQRYMAVVHSETDIENQSHEHIQLYRKLFAQVSAHYNQAETLSSVSEEGFRAHHVTEFNHEASKAWGVFLKALSLPNPTIKVEELPSIQGHEREIGKRILEKFERTKEADLTREEINFLRTRSDKFPNLMQGRRDEHEFAILDAIVALVPRTN